jgi:dienelactone hydrolase
MILALGGGVAIHCLVIAATALQTPPDCSTHTGRNRRTSPLTVSTQLMMSRSQKELDAALCSPLDWKSLNADTFLHLLDPKEYETRQQRSRPQMAASVQYAQSILDAWQEEAASWSQENGDTTEWTSILYHDRADDAAQPPIPLYGYMIRNTVDRADVDKKDAPVILLFPTAVGVHDVFLFYKAAQMVHVDSLRHCLVVIVDLFSDSSGWLWDKVTHADQYHRTRELLLHPVRAAAQTETCRPVLQSRIRSVLSYIQDHVISKPTSLAALGWCFGGHCIAELARMEEGIATMITFHGVFSELQLPILPPADKGDDNDARKDIQARRPRKSEILVCHGIQDPFVPPNDLEQALYVFWGKIE